MDLFLLLSLLALALYFAGFILLSSKKKEDINKGKWIGVGGHVEPGESPEDCLLREVYEETGLTLTEYRFRGLLTFLYNDNEAEYICLYTATTELNRILKKLLSIIIWQPNKIIRLPLITSEAFILTESV